MQETRAISRRRFNIHILQLNRGVLVSESEQQICQYKPIHLFTKHFVVYEVCIILHSQIHISRPYFREGPLSHKCCIQLKTYCRFPQNTHKILSMNFNDFSDKIFTTFSHKFCSSAMIQREICNINYKTHALSYMFRKYEDKVEENLCKFNFFFPIFMLF